MKKGASIVLIFVLLIVGLAVWYFIQLEKPGLNNDNRLTTVKEKLVADSLTPAAGVCLDAGLEDIVTIEVNVDVPSPRCQKISTGQKLRVVNKTEAELSLWFGPDKQYAFEIPAQDSYLMPEPASDLLETGVHVLYGQPYQGSEIWFEGDRQQDDIDGNQGILPYNSGVEGQVTVGPTCPVQRIPPEPGCADKPYPTTVQVVAAGSPNGSLMATMATDKEGKYRIMLPPGDYRLLAVGGNPLPQCEGQEVSIGPDEVVKVNIGCDSGIR